MMAASVVAPHSPPHLGIPPTGHTHPPQPFCSNDSVSMPPGRKPRSSSAHSPFPFLTIPKIPSEIIYMLEHWVLYGQHDTLFQKCQLPLVQQGPLITPRGSQDAKYPLQPDLDMPELSVVLASWVWGKGKESCSPRHVRNSCVGSGELPHHHHQNQGLASHSLENWASLRWESLDRLNW